MNHDLLEPHELRVGQRATYREIGIRWAVEIVEVADDPPFLRVILAYRGNLGGPLEPRPCMIPNGQFEVDTRRDTWGEHWQLRAP